jgi:hypothetical protein
VTLYKKRSQAMQISLRKTYFSQCVEGWVRWVLGLFLVGSDPDRSERKISEQTEIEINFNFPTNYLGAPAPTCCEPKYSSAQLLLLGLLA